MAGKRLIRKALKRISDEQMAEAMTHIRNALVDPMTGKANVEWEERAGSAREAFCNLWQHIHKRPHDEPTAWEENPWVWVIEFRRCPSTTGVSHDYSR